MLDLWQNNTAVAAQPQPGEARDLPATFGESFSAAWQNGRLFSDTLAHGNAQAAGFDQYLEDVKNASGEDIRRQVYADADPLTAARNIVGKMKAANPGLMTIPDLTDDELDHRAIVASQQARERYMQIAQREKAAGGGVGQFLGGLAAGATDPINLVGLAVAPEVEGGVLASATAWGTFGAVTQGVNEGVNAGFREKVQPGYAMSGEPVMNVLEAGAGGAVLGGGFKALGNLWTRVKTGAWPQSVRDAGNVVESEANIQQSNVLPGVEGEAAHRASLSTAINQILGGLPVDVAEASRALVSRLQAERPFTLPVMDEQAVRLISEEAGLRERSGHIDTQLGALPQGDISAADRLNRLQAVDSQIAEATDPATRRALNERRDQILVDTNPEALRAAAAPLEQRRALEAEQRQITSRLNEIEAQRTNPDLTPTEPPAMMGQTSMVRPSLFDIHTGRIDSLMTMRGRAGMVADQAAAERAQATATGELPFKAGAFDLLHNYHVGALSDGIHALGQLGGHEIPDEEAMALAQRVARAKDDSEAMTILNQVTDRPRTLYDTLPSAADFAAQRRVDAEVAATARMQSPEQMRETIASPDHVTALQADIDRAIVNGPQERAKPIIAELQRLEDELSKLTEDKNNAVEKYGKESTEATAAFDKIDEWRAKHKALNDEFKKSIAEGIKIPVGVDENGEPIFRDLEKATAEVDQYKAAAEQIAACAAPPAEEAEAA